MRPDLSSATNTLLASGKYDIHHRLQVANGSGTLIDVSTRLHAVAWADPSSDAPIATRHFEFLRELNDDPATSLAPLIASDLNVLDDGTTFSALLQLGRLFVHSFAITAVGASRPADGTFYEWCRGRLGTPSWGGKYGNARVSGMDQGGEVQRVKVETARVYDAGTAVETAIQAVLDDNGYSSIVLNVPVATGVVLSEDYGPGIQKSVWEIVQELASSIGFVCWWRYQADGAADLVLFEPARSNVTSAFTFPRIYDVEKLEINESALGNVILGQFTDADGKRVDNPAVVNSTSVSKYGGFRRAFWISEPEDSVIRTAADMTGIQNFALSDLAEPDAEATYRTPPHPGLECAVDVVTFPADDKHYDSAQVLAPFAIRGEHRARQIPAMQVDARGKPSGGSGMWRTRRPTAAKVVEPDSVTQISNVVFNESTTTGTLDFDVGAKITQKWLGYSLIDSPVTDAKWAAVAASAVKIPDANWPVTLTLPVESSGTAQILLVQIEARYIDPASGLPVVGDVERIEITPRVSIPAIDDTTGEIKTGAISAADMFASGIDPVGVVDALPADNTDYNVVLLTTDSKLYRWNGSAWTAVVPTTDLTGTIETAQIANLAVTAAKIGTAAVETAKLANLAVTEAILAAGAVTETKITDSSVTTGKINAAAVVAGKIATDAVTADKILANAVTAAKIDTGAVTADKILAGAVTTGKLDSLAVTTDKLAANAVTAAKIAANTITANELAADSIIAGKIATGAINASAIIVDGVVTASKISVTDLAAISVTLGTLSGTSARFSGLSDAAPLFVGAGGSLAYEGRLGDSGMGVYYDDGSPTGATVCSIGAGGGGATNGGIFSDGTLFFGVDGDIDFGPSNSIFDGQLTVAGAFRLTDGITAPATATGFAILYVDSADGDLKVKFGDGTVKTLATDT